MASFGGLPVQVECEFDFGSVLEEADANGVVVDDDELK